MVKLIRTKIQVEGRWKDVFVPVEEEPLKTWSLKDQLTHVGKKSTRLEGSEKVSGSAKYTQDIILPGMLYGKMLRCPYPCARIKHINTSQAEKLSGILTILTINNIPKISWYDGSYLLNKILGFQGDEVAFVVAEDEDIAEDALELIEIEYEKLPFVVDSEEAITPGSPKIHPNGNLWGGKPSVYSRGDVEKSIAGADVVLKETFRTQSVVQNSMETHGSVVKWDYDSLTVWDSTQDINHVRNELSNKLKIPINKVNVITNYMGGGFGSKNELGKYTVLAALASKRINRPVKVIYDRIEENLATGYRTPTTQHVMMGCNKDGKLLALKLEAIINLGYSAKWIPDVAGVYKTMYSCPNVKTIQYGVYTNLDPFSAFRAPGGVEGNFALESMMDLMAAELSIDPIDFRLRNYVETDQISNLPYSSKGLKDAYDVAMKISKWKSKRKELSCIGNVAKGIGVSSIIWYVGGGPPAYANVKINSDGTASTLTSTQDIGTGTETALAQITAEELSFPLDDVKVSLGDTRTELYSPGSGGSATLSAMGPAVRAAASDAKRQILEVASQLFEAPIDILQLKDGKVRILETGKEIGVDKIMSEIGNTMIIGKGFRGPNDEKSIASAFGVHIAEVEVDLKTGKVKVTRIVAVHESGRIINPLLVESQIEGGIIQGLGFALMEKHEVDNNTGNVLTTSFMDYIIPGSKDIPEIKTSLIEIEDTLVNSLGSKGIGEPPIIGVAPAISNAIYDATGVMMKELPIIPENILSEIEDKSLS